MNGPEAPLPGPRAIRHRGRLALVLLASLLVAVGQPLTSGLVDEEGGFDVFFSLLFAAVLLLAFEEKRLRRVPWLSDWLHFSVYGSAVAWTDQPAGRSLSARTSSRPASLG